MRQTLQKPQDCVMNFKTEMQCTVYTFPLYDNVNKVYVT